GPMPTPAVAYMTHTFNAQAGIVISASHNPYTDNGIKFFGHNGRKISDEIELEIEARIDADLPMAAANKLGKVRRIIDARGRYIEYCKSTVLGRLNLEGMKIVVDCANGAAYHIAPDVFEELGAVVIPIGVSPNGLNINEGCGSTSPELLQQTVLETGADLGIALDGDGYSLIMVDDQGNIVDGDELLYLLAVDRKKRVGIDGVVGTLMSNLGLEQALARQGIQFERANVGDRYVVEKLDQNNWIIGGESSGHLLCLDCATTGDGIVAALQVLAALAHRDQGLRDALADMHKLPQEMINVRGENRDGVAEHPQVQAAIQAAEQQLAGKGRVLLRPSGTEPLVRVMVEGENTGQVASVCKELAAVVEEAIQ